MAKPLQPSFASSLSRLHHWKPGCASTSATWPPSSQLSTRGSACGATQKRTTRKKLDAEQAPGIAAEDLGAVFGAHGQLAHPLHPGRVGDEGVIDREEYAVGAHLEQAAKQRSEERRVGKEWRAAE